MDCWVLPLVGRKMMIPTNGRTKAAYPTQTGIHATKWPLHAQWAVRQDISYETSF
jgi:hypothetical protein